MTERTNFASGSPWEPLRGYSRAVLVGDRLFVSGTTAMTPGARPGTVIAAGDPYGQTRAVIETVRQILSAAGFSLADVVRTRLFVTKMSRWEDYARAHHEAFEKIRPASSMVEVSRLADPRLMVEMEVDAERGATVVNSVMLGTGVAGSGVAGAGMIGAGGPARSDDPPARPDDE